jgi:hypothetical protein
MSGPDGKVEEASFKIVDRRRFDSDGVAKTDIADAEPVRAEPQLPRNASAERRQQPAPATGATAAPSPQPADPSQIDFMTFVASLGATALAALGALPKGAAGDIPENAELAREYIDILGMLQAKTRGNLTRDEDASLQRLLTDLRLQFVERTRNRGKPKR